MATSLANPPLPGAVTAQQAPLTAFAAQGGGQPGQPGGGQTGAPSQSSSMEMVGALISEITSKLEDAAKILAQEKPALLPMLKPVVQGLMMVQSQVGQKPDQQGMGMAGGRPGAPGPAGMQQTPQGQGAAVSAA